MYVSEAHIFNTNIVTGGLIKQFAVYVKSLSTDNNRMDDELFSELMGLRA